MKLIVFLALILVSCGCVTKTELTECKTEYEALMAKCVEIYLTLEYMIEQCPADGDKALWQNTY